MLSLVRLVYLGLYLSNPAVGFTPMVGGARVIKGVSQRLASSSNRDRLILRASAADCHNGGGGEVSRGELLRSGRAAAVGTVALAAGQREYMHVTVCGDLVSRSFW